MKQRLFRRDDRGSAIVIVLVAVAFLTILGSLLLFTTYTGYQMKMVSRKSTENFYTAESAMNEIRVGVQKAVSDSIASAYTDTLRDYKSTLAGDSEEKFQASFIDALCKWPTGASNGDNLLKYQAASTPQYTYNPDVLQSFLKATSNNDGTLNYQGGKLTFRCADDRAVEVKNGTAVAIRGLRIDYTDAAGYETSVSTDLSLALPSFSYLMSDLVRSAVEDYTIIAKDKLTCRGTGPNALGNRIEGNAYAGSVTIPPASSMIAGVPENSGSGYHYFISSGKITVQGKLEASSPALRLWAGGIDLSGIDATARLDCITYVRNDLALSGNGAAATLSGQYYGFGSSSEKGAESSSILITGQKTRLDVSSLRQLVLAGNSFIDAPQANVMMGESLSVRSNQLAYLVPFSCFDRDKANDAGLKSNPQLFANTDLDKTELQKLKAAVNLNSNLWGDSNTTLGHYINEVQTVYQQVGTDQTMVYIYMKFMTKALANEYFKAYFDHNAAQIENDLKHYTSEIKLGAATQSSAGGMLGFSGGDGSIYYTYSAIRDSIQKQMDDNAVKFQNLCSTLSTETASETNPYDYLVRDSQKMLENLSNDDLLTFSAEGATDDVRGVIVKGAADSTALKKQYSNLCVIITVGGDIKVTANFSGLLISSGSITVENANVSQASDRVSAALKATCTKDGTTASLSDFLNVGTQTAGSGSQTTAGSWDLAQLVTYDNWSKN